MRWFNPPPIEIPIQTPEIGEDLKSIPELIEQLKSLPEILGKYDPTSLADKLNPIPELIKILEPISKVCYILTHPVIIWDFIMGVSFWIVVIIGTSSIILYAVGYKKGMRLTGISFVAYTLLKGLDVAFR